jgi:hypothetical protein
VVKAVAAFVRSLNCVRTAFTSSDANTIIHRQHEDFAIANFAILIGPRGLDDRGDGGFNKFLIDGNLQLNLPAEIDRQFVPAKRFDLASLASEALAVNN